MKHLTLIILISSCTIILLPSVFGGWESCIKNAANCWAKYLERTLNKPGPLSEYLPSEYFYCCYIYDAFDCAKHVSGTDCSITLPFNGQNATKQNTSLRAADGCPNYEGSQIKCFPAIHYRLIFILAVCAIVAFFLCCCLGCGRN